MRSTRWMAAVVVFLLNPDFACGEPPYDFKYGAAEMRAAIEGTWTLTTSLVSGEQSVVSLHFEQGSKVVATAGTRSVFGSAMIRSAAACADRTLLKAAAACSPNTVMPLDVLFVDGDAFYRTASIAATFRVKSLIFNQGDLEIAVNGTPVVYATISNMAVPLSATLIEPTRQGTVTLVRVGP